MLLDLFGGDRPAVASLLQVALTEIERDLARIENATASGDTRALAEAAHSLKGASAGIGSTHVCDRSAEVEKTARGGVIATQLNLELRAAVAALDAEVRAFATSATG